MPKGPTPNEQRVLLEKVSWQKFETLLLETGRDRTARFSYDHGRLEMMTPVDEHERCNKLIESLILVLADELQIKIDGFKSALLKQAAILRATEPDACYYIQHEPKPTHEREIDLEQSPPPDLVLEISLSKSSLNKLPIYADMGIPEVWHYLSKPGDQFFNGTLLIYHRDRGEYVEADHSLAFPFLPTSQVIEFIGNSDAMGLMSALRALRSWVQKRV